MLRAASPIAISQSRLRSRRSISAPTSGSWSRRVTARNSPRVSLLGCSGARPKDSRTSAACRLFLLWLRCLFHLTGAKADVVN